MSLEEFKDKYIKPFDGLEYIFVEDVGYVVWRRGTGGNVELLHIRAFTTGRGDGSRLVKMMLKKLKENPPYFSIFGFLLDSNVPMKKVYSRMGFNLIEGLDGPYKHGKACLMWQSFDVLCEKNLLADEI